MGVFGIFNFAGSINNYWGLNMKIIKYKFISIDIKISYFSCFIKNFIIFNFFFFI